MGCVNGFGSFGDFNYVSAMGLNVTDREWTLWDDNEFVSTTSSAVFGKLRAVCRRFVEKIRAVEKDSSSGYFLVSRKKFLLTLYLADQHHPTYHTTGVFVAIV